MNKFGNYVQIKLPVEKTKEEEDAEIKESFLAFVRNFFDVKNVAPADLKAKIKKMHIYMCKLEGEKYDLEKHLELQNEYIKNTKEEMCKTHKDAPEVYSNGLRPSKINVFKKYDRQVDRRNYDEKRKIFEKQSENEKTCNGQISNKPIFANKYATKITQQ